MLHYKIKYSWPWFLFFSVIFSFYTITVVQYAMHFAMWSYCFLVFLCRDKGNLKKSVLRNAVLICGGYGLLVLWAIMSGLWAYDVMEGSSTLNGMIKILSIMLCMVLWVNNQYKVDAVMIAYVDALAVMSLLILVTSPISTFGTTDFGGITHQFRNTIANATFFGMVLLMAVSHCYKKNVTVIYFMLFLLTGLCTGSRRGIVQLALIGLLYTLTENNVNKKIKKFLLVVLLCLLGAIILSSVPYLRETYWTRLFSIFDTSTDYSAGQDASTAGRNMYRVVAMDMFRMRPFTGFGVDGFHCYLEDNPYTYTIYRLEAVYSHCNYTELLADFGIFGFLFYYLLHFNLIKKALKFYRRNYFFRITLIVMLATLVLDYGGISYQSTLAMYMYAILFLGVIYKKDCGVQQSLAPE